MVAEINVFPPFEKKGVWRACLRKLLWSKLSWDPAHSSDKSRQSTGVKHFVLQHRRPSIKTLLAIACTQHHVSFANPTYTRILYICAFFVVLHECSMTLVHCILDRPISRAPLWGIWVLYQFGVTRQTFSVSWPQQTSWVLESLYLVQIQKALVQRQENWRFKWNLKIKENVSP